MFDSIGSALDAASQMLAGGATGAGTSASAKPTYVRGKELDVDVAGDDGARAPNLDNAHDAGAVIEFIHFGNVHTSLSSNFPHPSRKDDDPAELAEGEKPRAIQFRAALERETILLSCFMEATQTVLQEREDSKGAAGAVLDTLGSLTGLGGGGSGTAKASDVNSHIQKVATVGKTLNVATMEYKITQQAGIDLHKARADYRELLRKIVEEPPPSDPMGGLMGSLPGIGGLAPGLASIVSLIQGIIFKPLDIKVKFFALLAAQQEKQIEAACNAMTLEALASGLTPIMPVWFPKDRAKWEAPESPVSHSDDSSNLLGGVQNEVADAADSVRNEVSDKANAVKDFFEAPKTEAPGAPFLSQAFSTAAPSGKKSEPMPMEPGALACQAFKKALGMESLPSFVETIVTYVVGINLDLLHGGFEAVLARDPTTPILATEMYEGARHRMIQRLINLALDNISFLKSAKEFQIDAPMGYSVRPGDLADKGVDSLERMANEKIGGAMNIPLQYSMDDLADQLELARQQGMTNKCHTMEVYLGRLPWMEAALFYNIFFPFWDALLSLMPGADKLQAVAEAAKKAKGFVDTGRDALKKANAVKDQLGKDQDKLAQGVSLGDLAGGKPPVGAGYGDAMDSKADEITGPKLDPGKFVFPLTGRLPDAEGKEILKADYEAVKPNHQWEQAENPPSPESDQDASQPSAAA